MIFHCFHYFNFGLYNIYKVQGHIYLAYFYSSWFCLVAERYRLRFLACLLSFTIVWRTSRQRMPSRKANPVSVRCEQSSQDSNSLDVWLGRLAMVGFAVAISVEISTGKGLLEVCHALFVFLHVN